MRLFISRRIMSLGKWVCLFSVLTKIPLIFCLKSSLPLASSASAPPPPQDPGMDGSHVRLRKTPAHFIGSLFGNSSPQNRDWCCVLTFFLTPQFIQALQPHGSEKHNLFWRVCFLQCHEWRFEHKPTKTCHVDLKGKREITYNKNVAHGPVAKLHYDFYWMTWSSVFNFT